MAQERNKQPSPMLVRLTVWYPRRYLEGANTFLFEHTLNQRRMLTVHTPHHVPPRTPRPTSPHGITSHVASVSGAVSGASTNSFRSTPNRPTHRHHHLALAQHHLSLVTSHPSYHVLRLRGCHTLSRPLLRERAHPTHPWCSHDLRQCTLGRTAHGGTSSRSSHRATATARREEGTHKSIQVASGTPSEHTRTNTVPPPRTS